MDVWFDSGSSWSSVVGGAADMYLEGSDQHRGWFQSSLLTSVAASGRAPYKTLLTHGFVLDERGMKMSKSLGNVIDPDLIVKGGPDKKKNPAFGADVLRCWVASTDYTKDVNVGSTVLEKTSESLRKIRNTARFMLANSADFRSALLLDESELLPIDRYMLIKLERLCSQVTRSYETFNYAKVYRALLNYCTVDLSEFYFSVSKDSLYCDALDSTRRRSTQTVLYRTLDALSKLIAPIACHLAEDIHRHRGAAQQSIIQCGWAKISATSDEAFEKRVEALLQARTDLLLAVEQARQAGELKNGAIEAAVQVELASRDSPLFSLDSDELRRVFGVSSVQLVHNPSLSKSISFSVRKAADELQCPRCWQYWKQHDETLCRRCRETIGRT
jgi:isoleucyl-tRNA synthetase